jgi:hypothetical protein
MNTYITEKNPIYAKYFVDSVPLIPYIPGITRQLGSTTAGGAHLRETRPDKRRSPNASLR